MCKLRASLAKGQGHKLPIYPPTSHLSTNIYTVKIEVCTAHQNTFICTLLHPKMLV